MEKMHKTNDFKIIVLLKHEMCLLRGTNKVFNWKVKKR